MVTKMFEMSKRLEFHATIHAAKVSSNFSHEKYCPTCNAKVSKGVIRDKVDHLIQLLPLLGDLRVELPKTVQPPNLEELLWEEKARDEKWLRGPEAQVLIMDIFHVGRRQHPIILASKVDQEAGWRQPFRCAV